VLAIFKIGSSELFAWAGFEPQSSWVARITGVSTSAWQKLLLLQNCQAPKGRALLPGEGSEASWGDPLHVVLSLCGIHPVVIATLTVRGTILLTKMITKRKYGNQHREYN
jgi:hypothetical protein